MVDTKQIVGKDNITEYINDNKRGEEDIKICHIYNFGSNMVEV